MAQEINDVKNIASAALAFLGDSVYEERIRERIVRSSGKSVAALNRVSKSMTNAKAQALLIDSLSEELTAEELAVFKRGRNVKSISAPKSCSISEYRRATGLEALVGYLFLTEQEERLEFIVDKAFEMLLRDC